nr:vitamin K-dependent protein Z-like [Oncorhynchus nerka]
MWIAMGSWRQWWFLSLSLLSSVLLVCSYGRVFRPPAHASTVFLRSKRANAFFLEEMLQGNLERECYEETCNYEEAREYFEDTPKTDTFWNVYVDGDQCKPNPCLHGGSCKDSIGGFTCSCTELYHGKNCEIDSAQCPTKGPFSCDHFCSPNFEAYQCSCTTGYKIHSDKRSCIPAG